VQLRTVARRLDGVRNVSDFNVLTEQKKEYDAPATICKTTKIATMHNRVIIT
jgi:hypothetical protein